MIKFITKVFLLLLTVGVGIFLTTVIALYFAQSDADKVYTLSSNQDVLVIGESQIGCGIVENAKYHDKVIWMADSAYPIHLWILRELERRHQLTNVKILIVNFNSRVFGRFGEESIQRVAYKMFPVSWRYLAEYPGTLSKFFYFAINNLWQLRGFTLCDSRAEGSRIPIMNRTSCWKTNFYQEMRRSAVVNWSGNIQNWEVELKTAIVEMKRICDSHGIRMAVVSMPLLPYRCELLLPDEINKCTEYENFLSELGIETIKLGTYGEDVMADAVHATEVGATMITEELYKHLGLLRSQ